MKYTEYELINLYWQSEDYKIWLKLACLNIQQQMCGYWYYDNDERKWKYRER
jgi:hypothetical protein